jgi:hypothetical protein
VRAELPASFFDTLQSGGVHIQPTGSVPWRQRA